MSRASTAVAPAPKAVTAPAPVAPATPVKAEKTKKPVYPIEKAVGLDGKPLAEKVGDRFVFIKDLPPEIRNEKGEVTQAAYSRKEFAALKSKDFKDEEGFILYKADIEEAKGQRLIKKAQEMRASAKEMAKLGDPKLRKGVEKARKLQDQLKALMEELQKSGVQL